MEPKDLQELLREKMDGMPKKAKRVVEYLLSNMREAAFKSIGEVADELAVSKAQLVRVARMLGFEGYSDLKEVLQQAILEQVNPAAMLTKVLKNRHDLPNQMLQVEHANLEGTWKQLEPEKVSAFCDIISNSVITYCMGWGISSLVAESLYMRLRVMGIRSILLKRSSLTLQEQTRSVSPDDVVVICELPSFVLEVTESVVLAKEQGSKIITITDSPAAPICKYSDLQFFVSAASPMFGSSILGPLFLVHLLSSVLAVNMGEKVQSALEKQAQFLHDERIFHPVFGLKYT